MPGTAVPAAWNEVKAMPVVLSEVAVSAAEDTEKAMMAEASDMDEVLPSVRDVTVAVELTPAKARKSQDLTFLQRLGQDLGWRKRRTQVADLSMTSSGPGAVADSSLPAVGAEF